MEYRSGALAIYGFHIPYGSIVCDRILNISTSSLGSQQERDKLIYATLAEREFYGDADRCTSNFDDHYIMAFRAPDSGDNLFFGFLLPEEFTIEELLAFREKIYASENELIMYLREYFTCMVCVIDKQELVLY